MKLYPIWLSSSLHHVREFFWPLIDIPVEEDEPNTNEEAEPEFLITDINLKQAFAVNQKISESEDSRRASIESKATSLISAIGISSSVVVAASTLTMNSNENLLAIRVVICISFVLIIYTIRTVWFAISALERRGYHVTTYSDINLGGDENEYQRALIKKMAEHTIKNQDIINLKVNSLVLAQEYYKRAIIVIFLYALFVLIYCLFIKAEKQEEANNPKYHYAGCRFSTDTKLIPESTESNFTDLSIKNKL